MEGFYQFFGFGGEMKIAGLEDLISKSSEVEIESFSYDGKLLNIKCYFDEIDRDVLIRIVTKRLVCSDFGDSVDYVVPCHIKLIKVDSKLEAKNGRFIANQQFGKFMSEVRQGLSLAYGLKENFIFQLKSYEPVISCLVNDERDIYFQVLD